MVWGLGLGLGCRIGGVRLEVWGLGVGPTWVSFFCLGKFGFWRRVALGQGQLIQGCDNGLLHFGRQFSPLFIQSDWEILGSSSPSWHQEDLQLQEKGLHFAKRWPDISQNIGN